MRGMCDNFRVNNLNIVIEMEENSIAHVSTYTVLFCMAWIVNGMPKMFAVRDKRMTINTLICVLCVWVRIYSIEKAFIFNTFKWKSPILSANVDGPINSTLLYSTEQCLYPSSSRSSCFHRDRSTAFHFPKWDNKKQQKHDTITYSQIRECVRERKTEKMWKDTEYGISL